MQDFCFLLFLIHRSKLLCLFMYMKLSLIKIAILCVLMIIIVFVSYKNVEGFDPNALLHYNTNSPRYSHSVDLPLNTTYGCKNMCGPTAQCLITKSQCTSDIDCEGCKPRVRPPPAYLKEKDIVAYNDAGKLIYNQNPQYSALTTDIGTNAEIVDKYAKVPKPYLGMDVWTKSYDAGTRLFDDKMAWKFSSAPEEYRYIPTYPKTETVTGLFEDVGPTASNAYLK